MKIKISVKADDVYRFYFDGIKTTDPYLKIFLPFVFPEFVFLCFQDQNIKQCWRLVVALGRSKPTLGLEQS